MIVILDTNILIDGRIEALTALGLFEKVFIPECVMGEMKRMADTGDDFKASKGIRGIECVQRLMDIERATVQILPWRGLGSLDTDSAILEIARQMGAHLFTIDFKLMTVGRAMGVDILSLNEIWDAMRPIAFIGNVIQVSLTRAGQNPRQAIGMMDDGTRVIVDEADHLIGQEVSCVVISFLRTKGGTLAFCRLKTTN